ncbi:MAG: TlpA family protein disulfide reductase [Gammaproteobacteria bacterium]|nr:TlpA family protein disulfide reductase [Gammaproteobacteria bacterium]
MKNSIIFIIVLILAGSAGFTAQRLMMNSDRQNLPIQLPEETASVIGQRRPDFELNDIEGNPRNINEWNNKVILVNFWATWCPPCKKEIPAFMELQEQYADQGFQIIGIAIDNLDDVKDYVDTMGINYPVMAAELTAMEIARLYGNRINALPFSAFVDRNGIITHIKPGELSKEATEKLIQSLL